MSSNNEQPPSWYTPDGWERAVVSLDYFGWGQVHMADPTYEEASRINQDGGGNLKTLARVLALYASKVEGEKWPESFGVGRRQDWEKVLAEMPTKVARRLERGWLIFQDDGVEAGNSPTSAGIS